MDKDMATLREAIKALRASQIARQPRTEQVHLRLSELERAELELRAQDAGLTLSEYVRQCTLGA